MRFRRVRLAAPAAGLAELREFYAGTLGLDCEPGEGTLRVAVGETALELAGTRGEPFYHYALLVPGDRFDAARAWAADRAPLLTEPGAASEVFDFSAWDALACYLHDPAGNIVELIAHRGLAESGRAGGFAGGELVGLSEVGLVGPPAQLAATLHEGLGLEPWDGAVAPDSRLGFVGARARTFVLCAEGRGWLPTGRPAERHPVHAWVSGGVAGHLEVGPYTVDTR